MYTSLEHGVLLLHPPNSLCGNQMTMFQDEHTNCCACPVYMVIPLKTLSTIEFINILNIKYFFIKAAPHDFVARNIHFQSFKLSLWNHENPQRSLSWQRHSRLPRAGTGTALLTHFLYPLNVFAPGCSCYQKRSFFGIVFRLTAMLEDM